MARLRLFEAVRMALGASRGRATAPRLLVVGTLLSLVAASLSPALAGNGTGSSKGGGGRGGGTSSGCSVSGAKGGKTYSDLSTAIRAAASGATLTISGTCTGNFVVSGKTLKLQSGSKGRGALDGGGSRTVLTVDSSAGVTLSGLTVTNGSAEEGGGIWNAGTLVLAGTTDVTGNTAANTGGGVHNTGSLLMTGTSMVSGNYSDVAGGGIANYRGTLELRDMSRIADNSAGGSGGGIYNSDGAVSLTDGSVISGNSSADGAGIYTADADIYTDDVQNTVILRGTSSVAGNSATSVGGGIYSFFGTVELRDLSTISRNQAVVQAGGIQNYYGTLNLLDASEVSGNTARVGGGIANTRYLHLSGSAAVRANASAQDGGGVYNDGYGSVDLAGMATISDNTAGLNGGGVFMVNGILGLADGSSIQSNRSPTHRGGGIFLASGTVSLGGTSGVSGNEAWWGAGIYNEGGSVSMTDGSGIAGNHATGPSVGGGGIYNLGSVTISGASSITGNTPNGVANSSDAGAGTLTKVSPWTGSVADNVPDQCWPDYTCPTPDP